MHEDETPRELQARLKDLYEKWINPSNRTKEEIGDQIILEQFLKLLNSDTMTWVKQNNPMSLKHAAEMAETFMAARRSVHQPRRWRSYKSSPTGKSVDDFGDGLSNLAADTHVSSGNFNMHIKKQQSVKDQQKFKSVIVCHGCGQPGHKRADCSLQKVTNTRLCYVPRPNEGD